MRHSFGDEWRTPIGLVDSLGPFDMDPCAAPENPTAKRLVFFEEDGLHIEWVGSVWLNPPWSDVTPWLRKLHAHGEGIALVPARTDTRWFQNLVLRKSSALLFLLGRLEFVPPPPGSHTSGRLRPREGVVVAAFGLDMRKKLKRCGIPGVLVDSF